MSTANISTDKFAASILGVGFFSPLGNMVSVSLPNGTDIEDYPAFKCPLNAAKGKLSASKIRRLGQSQRMALHVAHEAFEDASLDDINPHRLAVAVGTGLGELGETTRFLENMIRLNEAQPMPTRFVNSVHNSLASQIAINFAARGENHTFTQDFVSFELALWQSLQALRMGRAEAVLTCGADELSPYAILAGLRFGWWDKASQPNQFMTDVGSAGTLPGEGAAALLLSRCEVETDSKLPKITSILVHPLPKIFQSTLSTEGSNFIQRTLKSANASMEDIDMILVGANGAEKNDSTYRDVLQTVLAKTTNTAVGVYKHKCGEFCSGAALATALAARTLREQRLDANIHLVQGLPSWGTSSKILIYHLYPTGYQSAILVTI